jgi:large subunit ribosomal protein L16
MLMPKRVKYRKQQKGRVRGTATAGTQLNFGDYGLQVLECGWLTSQQLESARVAINRYIRRVGKMWIRVFPDKPITKKPAETRMGKGKGAPEYWVAPVRRGRILFELEGVSYEMAREAMRRAGNKLPLRVAFISRLKGE